MAARERGVIFFSDVPKVISLILALLETLQVSWLAGKQLPQGEE